MHLIAELPAILHPPMVIIGWICGGAALIGIIQFIGDTWPGE